MKERESDILKAILLYLRYKKVFCWRNNVGSFPISDGKGKQRYFRAGMPGMSDIIGLYSSQLYCEDGTKIPGRHFGRLFCIEVKTKKGIVSDAQRNFLNEIKKHGGLTLVARSVEDVKVYFP